MSGFGHRQRVLSNGLTVHVLDMPHLHSAYVAYLVRVGSRHERPEENGISHFLEHMLFRGCDGYPDTQALNGAIEDLGGSLDGFTTRDYTGYATAVHPDGLRPALEILGQMMRTPHLRGLTTERRVVREEMLDALDERGRLIEVDALAHEHLFGGHRLGQRIEGLRRNLPHFSRDALHRHRRRHYTGANSVLCIAGRIDRPTERSVERAFGPLPAGQRRSDGNRPPVAHSPASMRIRRHRSPQTRVRFSFRTVPEVHRDFPALVWLRRWLDGGLSAHLQTELVHRLGLAYEVSASLDSYSDVGLFDIELAVENDRLPRAVEALGTLVGDVVRREFSTEEIRRVQERYRSSFEFMFDSPSELTGWFGVASLFGHDETPRDRLQRVLAVEPGDVQRAVTRLFDLRRLAVTGVGGADPTTIRAARRALARWSESRRAARGGIRGCSGGAPASRTGSVASAPAGGAGQGGRPVRLL